MKRLIALLFICVLVAGCAGAPEPERTIHPKFHKGDFVELRLGPQGQIIFVSQWGNNIWYEVRVLTNQGPLSFRMAEFELRAKD